MSESPKITAIVPSTLRALCSKSSDSILPSFKDGDRVHKFFWVCFCEEVFECLVDLLSRGSIGESYNHEAVMRSSWIKEDASKFNVLRDEAGAVFLGVCCDLRVRVSLESFGAHVVGSKAKVPERFNRREREGFRQGGTSCRERMYFFSADK